MRTADFGFRMSGSWGIPTTYSEMNREQNLLFRIFSNPFFTFFVNCTEKLRVTYMYDLLRHLSFILTVRKKSDIIHTWVISTAIDRSAHHHLLNNIESLSLSLSLYSYCFRSIVELQEYTRQISYLSMPETRSLADTGDSSSSEDSDIEVISTIDADKDELVRIGNHLYLDSDASIDDNMIFRI